MNKLTEALEIAQEVTKNFPGLTAHIQDLGDGPELHISNGLPVKDMPGLVVILSEEMEVIRHKPFVKRGHRVKIDGLIVCRVVDESDSSVGLYNAYGYLELTEGKNPKTAKTRHFEYAYTAVREAFILCAELLANEAIAAHGEAQQDEEISKAQALAEGGPVDRADFYDMDEKGMLD